MRERIVSMIGVVLLLLAASGSADEIVFSDDFSDGIDPSWTVYGNAHEYNGRLLVWSCDEFDSGVESPTLERVSGSTLCIQGEYMTVTWPSGVADRGTVGLQWYPNAASIVNHLQFVTASGDTVVNRIRYIIGILDVGFVIYEADLGSFSADHQYMWRFEFTDDEYVISIDEGEGWEARYTGSGDDLLLLPPTLHLCLTGAGDGAGYWDDILVTRREESPVESLTWGRVKALYRR